MVPFVHFIPLVSFILLVSAAVVLGIVPLGISFCSFSDQGSGGRCLGTWRTFVSVKRDRYASSPFSHPEGTLQVSTVTGKDPGLMLPEFADWNGDGLQDLVVATQNCGVIYFQNVGNTSQAEFEHMSSSRNPFAAVGGRLPAQLLFHDFDGDGFVDLLAVTNFSGIEFYRNDGGGGAPVHVPWMSSGNPLQNVHVPPHPFLGSVVDLRGDGVPNIVFFTLEEPSNVSLWTRNSSTSEYALDATMMPLLPQNPTSESLYCREFVDIDNDMDVDLVQCNVLGPQLYENMAGSFRMPAFSSYGKSFFGALSGPRPVAVAFADMNGDGIADSVWASQNGNLTAAFSSPPLSRFIPRASATQPFPQEFGSSEVTGSLPFLQALITETGKFRFLLQGNLNQDDLPDLAVVTEQNVLRIFINVGASSSPAWTVWSESEHGESLRPPNLSEINEVLKTLDSEFQAITLADFSGDGLSDFLFAGRIGNTRHVFYYENDGAGAFANCSATTGAIKQRLDNIPYMSLRFTFGGGDLDGDGMADLVIGRQWEWQGKGLTLILSQKSANGQTTFVKPNQREGLAGAVSSITDQTAPYHKFTSPAIGDIDYDGLNDIVTGSEDGSLHVWINIGGLFFKEIAPCGARFGSIDAVSFSRPTLLDINGDGALDIAISYKQRIIVSGACQNTCQNAGTCRSDPKSFASPLAMPWQVHLERRCQQCQPGLQGDYCQLCSRGRVPSEEMRQGTTASPDCATCDSGSVQISDACEQCAPGKFKASEVLCLDCAPGFYSPEPGGADRCTPCPSDQLRIEAGATNCRPPSFGFVRVSALVELPCGIGEEPRNATSCRKCPVGRSNSERGGTCRDCPPGQNTRGSQGNAFCTGCGQGSYSNSDGSCSTCPFGWYQKSRSAGACLAIPSGHESNIGIFITKCSVGMFSSNFKCASCPEGTANAKRGGATCKVCAPGLATGALSGLSNCTLCARGKFGSYAGASTCETCPEGRYTPTKGAIKCNRPPPGFHVLPGRRQVERIPDGWGFATSCNSSTQCELKACEAGTRATNASCSACPPGKISTRGASSCVSCEVGRYADGFGFTRCKNCLDSKKLLYSDEIGASSCKACNFGEFSLGRTCADRIVSTTLPRIVNFDLRVAAPLDRIARIQWELQGGDESQLEHARVQIQISLDAIFPEEAFSTALHYVATNTTSLEVVVPGDSPLVALVRFFRLRVVSTREAGPWSPTSASWTTPTDCGSNEFLDQGGNPASNDPQVWRCQDCPLGAFCQGNVTRQGVRGKFGFWRASAGSLKFLPCNLPLRCLGAPNLEERGKWFVDSGRGKVDLAMQDDPEMCNENFGYQTSCGANMCRMCHVCRSGYGRRGYRTCATCPTHHTNIIFIAVVIAAALALLFLLVRSKVRALELERSQYASEKRILLTHIQVMGQLIILNIQWPTGIVSFLGAMTAVASPAGLTFSVECLLPGAASPAWVLYGVLLIFPSAVFVTIAFLFVYWVYVTPSTSFSGRLQCQAKGRKMLTADGCLRCRKGVRRHGSATYSPSTFDAFIASSVLLVYLVYTLILRLLFVAFDCVMVDGSAYLSIDLTEQCWRGRHFAYVIAVCVPVTLIIIVGLPIFAFITMVKNRTKLRDDVTLFRYGLLYAGYRKERWWWEVLVLLRKVSGCALSALLRASPRRVQIALAVFALQLILLNVGAPYGFDTMGKKVHQLDVANFAVLLLLLWVASLLTSRNSCDEEYGSLLCVLLTVAVIAADIAFLCLATFRCTRSFRHESKVWKRIVACSQKLCGARQVKPSRQKSQSNRKIEMTELPVAGTLKTAVSVGGTQWNEFLDPATGRLYFASSVGSSTWERPSALRNPVASSYRNPRYEGGRGASMQESEVVQKHLPAPVALKSVKSQGGSKWTQHTDVTTGRPYYANNEGESSWNAPAVALADNRARKDIGPSEIEQGAEGELPEKTTLRAVRSMGGSVWREYEDVSSGQTYFASEKGESSWTAPAGAEKL